MNSKSIALNSRFFLKIFILLFIFNACSDEGESDKIIAENAEITKFSFLSTHNPGLISNIDLDVEGLHISGRIEQSVNMKQLVATFEYGGSTITVNNTDQISSVTKNDFTDIVTYTVKTNDNKSAQYEVDVTKFTGLPIIHLSTDGKAAIDSKEDYVSGDISIDGGRFYSDFSDATMKIRGRGNSTWFMHPKKPYQLKLGDEAEILGMPAEKKWLFLAEYSDKTLMRNSIAFEMGYLSKLDWTPQSVLADVFINESYNGTYNVSEKVEEGNNRVAIGKEGYLLEIDQLERMKPDDVFFYTDNFLINIKEPETEYNSETYNYAKDLLNEFETVLYGSQYKDPLKGYAKYIDVDSFIDWYLISEITKNQDSKSFSSIFLNVIPGEKIKMGPLWDFDLAFGNVNYSECQYPEGFWVKHHKWYERLFQDRGFTNKVKERFIYFKENENFILDKMDAHAHQLRWSQQENDLVWKTLGTHVWPNPVVYDTYEEEVDHLKKWYSQRMAWLDTAFKAL